MIKKVGAVAASTLAGLFLISSVALNVKESGDVDNSPKERQAYTELARQSVFAGTLSLLGFSAIFGRKREEESVSVRSEQTPDGPSAG